ncbi:hypothetical protein ACIQC9_13255 [Brevundimonas sp. NPDC092305]|uniref:hypothetical protein n=1 Tax=Brevundimonas sp. NPDC092305 TaxID=3363957 RepID=UPI003827F095
MRTLFWPLPLLALTLGFAPVQDWVKRPDPQRLADAYPGFAAHAGLEGYARIACGVAATGALENCRVIEESPVGLGFGAAALSVSDGYLADRQDDEVAFTNHFSLPPLETIRPWDGSEPGPEVMEAATQYTRRLNLSLTRSFSLDGLPDDRREAVSEIIAEVEAETGADLRAAYALSLARTQSLETLRMVLVGQRRPGRSPFTDGEIARAEDQLKTVGNRQNALVQQRYCALYDCGPGAS